VRGKVPREQGDTLSNEQSDEEVGSASANKAAFLKKREHKNGSNQSYE
jgi:hypothetical protein